MTLTERIRRWWEQLREPPIAPPDTGAEATRALRQAQAQLNEGRNRDPAVRRAEFRAAQIQRETDLVGREIERALQIARGRS